MKAYISENFAQKQELMKHGERLCPQMQTQLVLNGLPPSILQLVGDEFTLNGFGEQDLIGKYWPYVALSVPSLGFLYVEYVPIEISDTPLNCQHMQKPENLDFIFGGEADGL